MNSTGIMQMCKDGTLSCDEFMVFWQDRTIRSKIYREAWLRAKSIEGAEDLRQEAWTAICQLPPNATFAMAERAAHKAIFTIYRRDLRRKNNYGI